VDNKIIVRQRSYYQQVPVLKYSTETGWLDNSNEQQHTTQHEPSLPSKSLQTEKTGLTLSSVFTTDQINSTAIV
jgi:hypothetical protein